MNSAYLPSFVKRLGRITESQKNNLKDLSFYEVKTIADCWEFVANSNAILDIGFGDGDFTISLAEKFPNTRIIASEVYKSGIGSLLGKVKAKQIEDIKVFLGDVRDILISESKPVFNKVFVMFPDPWQKARHHKRRLISPTFFKIIKPHLTDKAEIFISTDWENYSESIIALKDSLTDFLFEEGVFTETAFETRFAKRAIKEGRLIKTFKFTLLK